MQVGREVSKVLAFLLLLGCGLVGCDEDSIEAASATSAVEPAFTPVLMRVLAEPIATPGSDQRWHLVYELELRNATTGHAVLEQVEVRDPVRAMTLAAFSGEDLTQRLQVAGQRVSAALLDTAQFGVLYLHLSFPDESSVPLTLEHRVTAYADAAPPDQKSGISTGGISAVARSPQVVLGPPLRGQRYFAADGCCTAPRHIRALLPLNGEYRLSQRFAIDWEQLDAENRIYVGPRSDPRSYFIYGQEALAVADATVATAVDGLPEATPGEYPQGLNLTEADGNHVILDLGQGVYVLYAHFQPGSVSVRTGDRVQRGQVLGRVGNSGNSLVPHLHLHVMDAPSGLVANGLPYMFDHFRITGINKVGTADFDHAEATGEPVTITPIEPPSDHVNQLPLDLTVIDWLND
ncbi:MAG: hypothetical protein QG599_2154 [Pseudomonadota bacterium]|nr:hypothetical protein [Pseudomonadota bacterium]